MFKTALDMNLTAYVIIMLKTTDRLSLLKKQLHWHHQGYPTRKRSISVGPLISRVFSFGFMIITIC